MVSNLPNIVAASATRPCRDEINDQDDGCLVVEDIVEPDMLVISSFLEAILSKFKSIFLVLQLGSIVMQDLICLLDNQYCCSANDN